MGQTSRGLTTKVDSSRKCQVVQKKVKIQQSACRKQVRIPHGCYTVSVKLLCCQMLVAQKLELLLSLYIVKFGYDVPIIDIENGNCGTEHHVSRSLIRPKQIMDNQLLPGIKTFLQSSIILYSENNRTTEFIILSMDRHYLLFMGFILVNFFTIFH